MFTVEDGDAAFLKAVAAYARHNVQPWHTPGHKQGRGAPSALKEAFGTALQCDLSDVLYDPASGHSWDVSLREAEQRAATLFGAAWTRFLVNGTSGGVHAMLLATVGEGDTVIVPREAHLCVAGGLVLSGAMPRYLPRRVDPDVHLPIPPGAAEYAAALSQCPDAKAVVVTYPNYYGLCCDLEEIANTLTRRGPYLLVDEAHGAHYAFHSSLPPSALSCGAQVVVQSTHKTLSGLTQASMLHAASGVDVAALERALGWVQTTSPSSLLLASLDSARAQMAKDGQRLWERALYVSDYTRVALNTLAGVRCLGSADLQSVAPKWDSTRLIFSCDGLSGLEVAAALRSEFGIQVEMADQEYVVALVGLGDNLAHAHRLVAAVDALRTRLSRSSTLLLEYPPLPPIELSPRQAAQAQFERTSWHQAVGRVAAQTICPYPPGVPVVVPGEVITPEVAEYVQQAKKCGFYLRGDLGDGSVSVVA